VTAFAGSLLFLLLMYYIWSAVDAASSLETSVTAIVAYLGMGQVMKTVAIADMENFFGEKIRRGDIVNELKRPVSFRNQAMAYEVGRRGFGAAARSLPLLVVLVVFLGVDIPGLWRSMAFLLSAALAVVVGLSVSYIFTLLIFWTKVEWSLSMTRYLLTQFFGGMMFPLYLLPEAWKPLFFALPFHTMIDAPVSIFLGRTPFEAMPQVFLTQLGWIAGLAAVGFGVWKLAKRKLTIQGG
jgi:ABC-2 type transport system permease protein